MPVSLNILAGKPAPFGPNVENDGVNFALFSAHATSVTLCLYASDGQTETGRDKLPGKTGDVWHGFVTGLKAGQLYGYRVDGPYLPSDGHRFNPNKLLIDPYAKQLHGAFIQNDALYGYDVHAKEKDLSFSTTDSAPYLPKSVIGTPNYKWGADQFPKTDWADTIIYEAHVKGLTKRYGEVPSAKRGTLSGLSDPAIITHLKDLGVTAIELLPVQSFFSEPRLTKMGLTNYWGYNPVNYFAAHTPYLGPRGATAFQEAVKNLHRAGIEVILDVVYNHTGESWELGPTLSYRGIDNASYYRLKPNKRFYVNHTGTGNTLNMSHPRVLDLTLESLRYWVETMHVDGFRFDLAPTLARHPKAFNAQSPFLQAVKSDPVLSKTKLIAEPWDIGPGGYVLGQFPDGWAEWNDRYRDDVRSFWRGDAHAHQHIAKRLLGSADIFDHGRRKPSTSINLITAHDGFNLHDTVSFNHKHNQANGEKNRDGHGHNLSDNMGVEGTTNDPGIINARRQRKKNFLATLLLSQGTPMLLAGDEFGHSQQGNNNAYCQDNEISWLDWAGRDQELEQFARHLISLRKTYPHFSQSEYMHGETVSGSMARNVDWVSPSGRVLQNHEWEDPHLACLGMVITVPEQNSILVIINRGGTCEFKLAGTKLNLLLTTSNEDASTGNIPAHSICVFENDGMYVPVQRRHQALAKHAKQYGIVDNYRDIQGHTHTISDDTREKLLAALGVEFSETETIKPFADPKRETRPVYGAHKLGEQGGCWGVTAALYGLRSERNWGVGDFEDLACLAEIMAAKGADFIGINPVHALFPSASHLYAPYSPSSRQFLNVMLIAPDKIPELSDNPSLGIKEANTADPIDYQAVYLAKMTAFETAFAVFSKLPKSSSRRKAFHGFVDANGVALQRHALFDALFETLPASKRTYEGWKNFPKKFTDPESKACRDFADEHADRVEFYTYLQWVAHCQLRDAQSRAKAAGMSVGVYLDFAVGIVPGGADAWQHKSAYAKEVSLGAPGDMANPDGQVWNLVPFNPHVLAHNNFEPYRHAVRRSMSLGGAVRIDHILGHLRNFWIPKSGGEGGYVNFPFEGLIHIIAEESHAQKCIIFGEDLGTVPDGFRDRMKAVELMGCNVALIERDSAGAIIPREHMRELSITAFSNHDFPTLTGYWNGEDFRWREQLKIGDDAETLKRERERREEDKSAWLHLVGWKSGDAKEMSAHLMAKLQSYLAASPALAFAVQLDDLLLEPLQANVPGTTDEQPNWRRRSLLTLDEIAKNPDISQICQAIDTARKGN